MHGAVILVVEDEPAIAETLLYALRTEGFSPAWCATAGEADRHRRDHGEPALVLLDVGLPDANGFDWCRSLRRRSAVPVIFLTARESEIDRVAGLELGADDYVAKPFSPREVVARVRAVLRRVPGAPEPVVPGPPHAAQPVPGARDFAVTEDGARVLHRGLEVPLSRRELALLRVFLERPGRVWSREDLLARAWPEPEASLDRTVDAHVKLLRAKLRAVHPDAERITTHRGLGYSLSRDPDR